MFGPEALWSAHQFVTILCQMLHDFDPDSSLLLVIIELFSLGVRAEALRENINWKLPFLKRGSVWPKISGRRGRPPPTILSVGKLDELNFHMV